MNSFRRHRAEAITVSTYLGGSGDVRCMAVQHGRIGARL